MILDGDLSVRPEELPGFYRAWASGTAEFVNGSRLVYDVEPGAMRFANMVGNKVFSLLLKAIMGQQVKDTLCGTKVLDRRSYDRIAAGRSYFGEFDPSATSICCSARPPEPEDRRLSDPLPAADVRRDQHQPLAPRSGTPTHDALCVLEVPCRGHRVWTPAMTFARGRQDSETRRVAPGTPAAARREPSLVPSGGDELTPREAA